MAKPARPRIHQHIVTTLGKETSFSGVLRFKESLKISGKFEGEIDSKGFLFVDVDSEVRVKRVRAMNIVIGGTVYGDIEAAEKLELLATAKVYGNIRTSKLRIADGVVLEGRCDMLDDPLAFSPFAQQARDQQ